jgi:hypothetical protein
VIEGTRRIVNSVTLGALVAVLAGGAGWHLATRRAREVLRESAQSLGAEMGTFEGGLRLAEVAIRREGPGDHCAPLVGAASRGRLPGFMGQIAIIRRLQAVLDSGTDANWLEDIWKKASVHENEVLEGSCASWVHCNPADPNYWRPGWE